MAKSMKVASTVVIWMPTDTPITPAVVMIATTPPPLFILAPLIIPQMAQIMIATARPMKMLSLATAVTPHRESVTKLVLV